MVLAIYYAGPIRRRREEVAVDRRIDMARIDEDRRSMGMVGKSALVVDDHQQHYWARDWVLLDGWRPAGMPPSFFTFFFSMMLLMPVNLPSFSDTPDTRT